MITLATLSLMAFFYYGIHFLATAIICVLTAVAAEFILLRLMHKKIDADDLSCTSDALIIALMMPASINYLIAALAVIFGTVVAKPLVQEEADSPAEKIFYYNKQLACVQEAYVKKGSASKANDDIAVLKIVEELKKTQRAVAIHQSCR